MLLRLSTRARAGHAPELRAVELPAGGHELALDDLTRASMQWEDRCKASVADARPELSRAVVVVKHATILASGRTEDMPDDDRETLPLIPIREETGLPPPPESGVRRVLRKDPGRAEDGNKFA